jgi:Flp pilus assembly protein TadG
MTMLGRLFCSDRASAAAEMALATPLLLVLLFGAVDMGKYFRDEHVVVEAVRDGARYAARQQMDNFANSGSGCQSVPLGTVAQNTKNIVRTGNVAGTGSRLSYWTDNSTITVTVTCTATVDGENMGGIYSNMTSGGVAIGAPVVTVSVSLPYESLFGLYTFRGALSLNAQEQAAVMGI